MDFEDSHAAKTAGAVRDGTGPDSYQAVLDRIRKQLSKDFTADKLANAGPQVTEAATRVAAQQYRDYNNEALTKSWPRSMLPEDIFVEMALADLLGMGAIDTLLRDESIEDIAINGPTEVMVYRNGRWDGENVSFPSADRLLEILNRGLAHANRKANMVTPIADAVLKGKERISVVTYPVATPHPTAVIRIPRAKRISLEDMTRPVVKVFEGDRELDELLGPAETDTAGDYSVDYEKPEALAEDARAMLSKTAAAYLYGAVLAGLNIVAVGPTGSGKTTLLMALGRKIPKGERILIIEDTPEIDLYPGDPAPNNVLYLRTRPSTVEGLASIEQEDLVKLALRQRPDALTLGEARGPEVFDLLNALNTGHKNGLTSLHAYGVEELFSRMYLMLAQSERGRHLDAYRAASLVASTLHVAVSLEMVGKTRFVRTIAELSGKVVQKGTAFEPEMQAIFQRDSASGRLRGPLYPSLQAARLKRVGVGQDVFAPA
jgi:pilus assembly protein CpaF